MAILQSLHPCKNRASLFALITLAMVLVFLPRGALSASGGVMGGSGFSSGDSYSFGSNDDDSFNYVSISRSSRSERDSNSTIVNRKIDSLSEPEIYLFFLIAMIVLVFIKDFFRTERNHMGDSPLNHDTESTSIVKLQVALLGTARSFQADLNRVADSTNTSNRAGFKYVLTESTLALLHHSDFWISSYLSVDVQKDKHDGEIYFNKLSMEERDKFDKETHVNLNNFRKQECIKQRSNGANEFIVVTFLVAAMGVLKLPLISNTTDLKAVLELLGGLPQRDILATHVLWTPQDEKDTLSSQRMLLDYSYLNPLEKEIEINIY